MSNQENKAANNQQQQAQESQVTDKQQETVIYRLGKFSFECKPRTMKILKALGIGAVVIGATAVGSKIGSSVSGRRSAAEIGARDSEIARLNALLADGPALIETAADNVVESIPEVVDIISE